MSRYAVNMQHGLVIHTVNAVWQYPENLLIISTHSIFRHLMIREPLACPYTLLIRHLTIREPLACPYTLLIRHLTIHEPLACPYTLLIRYLMIHEPISMSLYTIN